MISLFHLSTTARNREKAFSLHRLPWSRPGFCPKLGGNPKNLPPGLKVGPNFTGLLRRARYAFSSHKGDEDNTGGVGIFQDVGISQGLLFHVNKSNILRSYPYYSILPYVLRLYSMEQFLAYERDAQGSDKSHLSQKRI